MDEFFPTDPVAREALAYIRSVEHPAIVNHSVRTYLHARRLSARLPLDDKPIESVLAVACLFHDAGATDAHNTDERFEVAGADAAAAFLQEHGFDMRTVDQVWEAIALHTSPGIAERRGAVTRLVRLGVSADFGDGGSDEDRTIFETEYPRLHIEHVLSTTVVEQALARPSKAPGSSWAGRLVHEHHAHPFGDDVNPSF